MVRSSPAGEGRGRKKGGGKWGMGLLLQQGRRWRQDQGGGKGEGRQTGQGNWVDDAKQQ
jgi:hypothetical protein